MNKALLRVDSCAGSQRDLLRKWVMRFGVRGGIRNSYKDSMVGQSNRKGLWRVSIVATDRWQTLDLRKVLATFKDHWPSNFVRLEDEITKESGRGKYGGTDEHSAITRGCHSQSLTHQQNMFYIGWDSACHVDSVTLWIRLHSSSCVGIKRCRTCFLPKTCPQYLLSFG